MIKNIVHLADIHIRLLQRHKEYKEVFEKLYTQLKEDTTLHPDDSIILLAGDILHSKTDLSPEAVSLASDLLVNLCNILPVVLIAGNHDGNLSNNSRLDALTPIVNALNLDNLYYFKDTGVYDFNDNIQFGLASVFDKVIPDIKTLDKNKVKIALYHGVVSGAKTEAKYTLTGRFNVESFKGYDLVLLGDIHTPHQFLNKEKTVGYPGSLIAQNYGETELNRGYFIWNLETLTAKEIYVPNDYAYLNLYINDGELETSKLPNHFPKSSRVRIHIKDTTHTKAGQLIEELREKYGLSEVVLNWNNISNSNTANKLIDNNFLENIKSIDYQNLLLNQFFEKLNDDPDAEHISEEDIKEVLKLNEEVNTDALEISVNSQSHNWKLKKLEFSNMFSYGEDNVIEFFDFKDVIGIFGKNHSGKSALLDILLFTLFDKSHRANKGADILNNKKETFHSKVNFEINGVDYYIEKKGSKRSETNDIVKVDIDFWKEESGVIELLNEAQRKQTAKRIRGLIGELEDFVLTSTSLQNSGAGFIDMKQSERKEFLSQLLKMDIYEQLHSYTADKVKAIKAEIKVYSYENAEDKLYEANNNLKEYTEKLRDEEEELKKFKTEYDEFNAEVIKQTKSIKANSGIESNVATEIDNYKEKIKAYHSTENTQHDTKKSLMNSVISLEKEIVETEAKIALLEKFLSENEHDVAHKKTTVELLMDKYNVSRLDAEVFTKKLDLKLEKVKKLKDLEYDPNCGFCMNNIFVKDAIETKNQIEEDKKTLKILQSKESDYKEELLSIKEYANEINEYEGKKEKLKKLDKQLSHLKISRYAEKEKLEIKETYINGLEKIVTTYSENQESINWNIIVENKILNLKIDIDRVKKLINISQSNIKSYSSNISVFEHDKKRYEEQIINANKIKEELKLLQYYSLAISKNGIPYMLITQVIPILEEEANNILSLMTDFSIVFELDGKNINLKIAYATDSFWAIELSSGFEKFISSLAIRIALTKISNLAKPNFIAIDEGFGSFDTENISNVGVILEYLKTQFDFIIIISHLDTLKSSVDYSIEIEQHDGFSKIDNTGLKK